MFGPDISGGDARSPVLIKGILVRGVFRQCFQTPRTGKPGFSHDSWSSHDDVMMTLGFS